ncbi:hypothetical protein BDV97DRAFT_366702 [Delphinella strobiligena]|nr:hypothetical protein BDV97DRAFT_366702 [Delphinella strobiligena]
MPFIASQMGRILEQPISAGLSFTQSCFFFRLPQELRDDIHIAVLMNDPIYHPAPGVISVFPLESPREERIPKSSWSSSTFRVKTSESDFGWLASCRDNHYEVSQLYFRYKRFYFETSEILANVMIHSPGCFRLRQNIQHLDLQLTLDGGMTKLVANIMNKMPSLKTLTVRFLENPGMHPGLMDMFYLLERFGRLCDVRGLESLHFADAFGIYGRDQKSNGRAWYWIDPTLVSDGDLLGTLMRERVCLPRGGRIARFNEVGEGAAYWYDIPVRLCEQAQKAEADAKLQGREQRPGPSAPHPALRIWAGP